MKRIVCFGDSNTWGYDAVTDGRYGKERWTRVLMELLGDDYEVIEEGLCGRTTVFRDPLNEGMSGLDYLYPCLMGHSLFDTLVVMLGTNDCKERYSATPKNIADGMKRLVEKAKILPVWTGEPDILIVAPSPIRPECEQSFVGGEMGKSSARSYGLAEQYRICAELTGCRFFDASEASVNQLDYMHLDVAGHKYLAEKIAELVK